MRERSTLFRFIIPIVVLLGLACGPCGLLSGSIPTPPHVRLPYLPKRPANWNRASNRTCSGQPGQQFILRMSDEEVTSLVATKLAQYDGSPVTNPVIWFTKGKIYGTGTLVNCFADRHRILYHRYCSRPGWQGRGRDGKSFHRRPAVAQAALDTISQSINETVEESQLDVEVTDLEILEGEIMIKGMTK